MDNEQAPKAEKKKPSVNNLMKVTCGVDEDGKLKDFFYWWCIFLRPFVSLTNRELDVVASFLRHRWMLSEHISDPALLDAMLMSEDIKRKVQEDCDITLQHFYVVMSNLKKTGVIVNNAIDPRIIPNIKKNKNGIFLLGISFQEEKFKEDDLS